MAKCQDCGKEMTKANGCSKQAIKQLIHEAEASEKEAEDYLGESEKNENLLNDWERSNAASFAEGYAAGLREAIRRLEI